MTRILLIETSAALCSVALGENGRCVAYKESAQPRSHAAMTAVLIEQLLQERGLRVQDCDAVCVSKGPGSYTGLRVGVSSAKGLCFGAGIPLLAVGTLDLLTAQAIAAGTGVTAGGMTAAGKMPSEAGETISGLSGLPDGGWDAIIPVIDARRDEVYTAVYTPLPTPCPESAESTDRTTICPTATGAAPYQAAGPVRSLIVGQDDWGFPLDGRAVLFIGDAADKCRRLLPGPAPDLSRCRFVQTLPRADAMAALAQEAFDNGKFEDVAYFEPFYLKDFVATTPKKSLF